MAETLHATLMQLRPAPTVEDAIDEVAIWLQDVEWDDTNFLFLPEYCAGVRILGDRPLPDARPEGAHPFLIEMQEVARSRGIWALLGSVAVPSGDGRALNRSILLNPNGDIVSRYDKVHLYDFQKRNGDWYRESDGIAHGAGGVVVETPFGVMGHAMCYDLRFPGFMRDLTRAGAEFILCPAAFPQRTGAMHWHTLVAARAIENGVFMIAPNAYGRLPDGGGVYGHSLIVDPLGDVVVDGLLGGGLRYASIHRDAVLEARRMIPSLQHERSYEMKRISADVTVERALA